METLEVGMGLHASYSLDGKFYQAVVKAVSKSKKRQKAPVQVEFMGYGTKEWKSIEELKSKRLREAATPKKKKQEEFPDQLGVVARQHCRQASIDMVEKLLGQAKERDALAGKLLLEARRLTSEINSRKVVKAYIGSSGPRALTRAASQSSAGNPGSPSTPAGLVRSISGIPEGKWPTKVIGVCGMSCSGKSTVTESLQAYAKDHGVYVPVLAMDDSYAEHMFTDPDDEPKRQPTMVNVKASQRGWRWKNWETKDCMDWGKFEDSLGVQMAIHLGFTPFIIIEGFLMLEHPQVAEVCDHVIAMDIEKETAWQRRLGRATETAQRVASGEPVDDYEKLKVYAFTKDHEAIREEAKSHVEGHVGRGVAFPQKAQKASDKDLSAESVVGGYSWLRLYFDEVIWPEAEKVQQSVRDAKEATPDKIRDISAELTKEEIAERVSDLIRTWGI